MRNYKRRKMTPGGVFSDQEVARLYRCRARYPPEVLATLRRLMVAPRTILDVGAGTEDLARQMMDFTERVDSVDPSDAMIGEGRRLWGGMEGRLNCITARMEDAPSSAPYGLMTAVRAFTGSDFDVTLAHLRGA